MRTGSREYFWCGFVFPEDVILRVGLWHPNSRGRNITHYEVLLCNDFNVAVDNDNLNFIPSFFYFDKNRNNELSQKASKFAVSTYVLSKSIFKMRLKNSKM